MAAAMSGLRKRWIYICHNPGLAFHTALRIRSNRSSSLTQALLRPPMKGRDFQVRWINDFKCQSCGQFLGERYVAGTLGLGDCASCREWGSPAGVEILTTALKGNALGSGDCEVEFVIRKFLRPGDVFVDIGGCIGYFSAMASSICGPTGKIYVFEPLPLFQENIEYLKKENPNIDLIQETLAVSDEAGEAKFRIPKHFHLSSNFIDDGGYDRDFLGELDEITVRKIAFHEYFANRRIDFIKIDVEGHEPAVLRSFCRWLNNCDYRPHVIFEHDHRNYNKQRLSELVTTLNKIVESGYRMVFGGTNKSALSDLEDVNYTVQLHLYPVQK